MPYTRRDLIRDAALIAATGAVAGAPSILGCHAAPPETGGPFWPLKYCGCGGTYAPPAGPPP